MPTAPLPNFLRRPSMARSAWADRRSSMSVSSAVRAGTQRADAGAHQAERGAVDFLRQHFAGHGENLGRELGRGVDRLRAGALPEIRGLQFQRDRQPRKLAVLEPRGYLLRQPPEHLFECGKIADVGLEGGLAGNGLGAAIGHHAGDRRCRAPAATAGGPRFENCFISSISSARCRSAMVRKPARRSFSWVAGPTPKMKPTGLSASIARASASSITAKPRGLSRSEAILARNLLAARPDRDGDADLALDLAPAAGPASPPASAPCSRSVPARSSQASSSESVCTSGVSARMLGADARPTRRGIWRSPGGSHRFRAHFRALNIGIAERTPNMRAM